MGFLVDKEALGQGVLPGFQFSTSIIIPHLLHIPLHLNIAVTRRPNEGSLGTFNKATFYRK